VEHFVQGACGSNKILGRATVLSAGELITNWYQRRKMRRTLKEKSRRFWAKRFTNYAEVGVPFWGVLPSPNAGETCAAALALNGHGFPLSKFKSLPLPECDIENCKCCLYASKTAEWEPLHIQ
jgi:hypothetical protein